MDAAIPAVRAGDGDAAAAITADVRATVAGLRAAGQQRMAVGGVLGAALLAVVAAWLLRRSRAAGLRRAEAETIGCHRAVAVAVAGAHQRPAADDASDDSPTQAWTMPILVSDPDPDLGSLVRARRRSPLPRRPRPAIRASCRG